MLGAWLDILDRLHRSLLVQAQFLRVLYFHCLSSPICGKTLEFQHNYINRISVRLQLGLINKLIVVQRDMQSAMPGVSLRDRTRNQEIRIEELRLPIPSCLLYL